jgi:hypothetical protein
LEKIDDEHRPRETWCVGVRWDMFEKQDLLEIVDVSRHSMILSEGNVENVAKVPRRDLAVGHLSPVLRGLHGAWSRCSRPDHLEGTAESLQVRRSQRTWRFSASQPEGEFPHALV